MFYFKRTMKNKSIYVPIFVRALRILGVEWLIFDLPLFSPSCYIKFLIFTTILMNKIERFYQPNAIDRLLIDIIIGR